MSNIIEKITVTGLTSVTLCYAEKLGWQISTETVDAGRECNQQLIKDERYRIYQFMQALHDRLDADPILKPTLKRTDDRRNNHPVVLVLKCTEAEKATVRQKIQDEIKSILELHSGSHHFRDGVSRSHSAGTGHGDFARGQRGSNGITV